MIIIGYLIWITIYRLLSSKPQIQKVFLTLGLVMLTGSGLAFAKYHQEISETLGRKATFGGRTTIWEVTYDWIKISPVAGQGGSFWLNQGGSATSNHHHEYVNRGYNGFLDSLVQSGLLAPMLLLAVLILLASETKLRWGEKFLLLLVALLSMLSETHSFAGNFLSQGATTARAILIFWVAYTISQNQALLKKNIDPSVLNLPKPKNTEI
jgi:O-antigen ligase